MLEEKKCSAKFAQVLMDKSPPAIRAAIMHLDLGYEEFLREWAKVLEWGKIDPDVRSFMTYYAGHSLVAEAARSPYWKALFLLRGIDYKHASSNFAVGRSLRYLLLELADTKPVMTSDI